MRVLIDGLAELIAPTRCAGCELPGRLLCARCDEALPRIQAAYACPRCGAPYGALVCTECWSSRLAFEGAVALGVLDAALARAVVLHKDANERRLGAVLGEMLGRAAFDAWGQWPDLVTWVPPTDEALRRRGFDHARGLAQPVAAAFGRVATPILSRARARDQRALTKVERAANARGTVSVDGSGPGLRGTRVLVVDDVLTTGATLDSCAEALLAMGADAVRVAIVARAW